MACVVAGCGSEEKGAQGGAGGSEAGAGGDAGSGGIAGTGGGSGSGGAAGADTGGGAGSAGSGGGAGSAGAAGSAGTGGETGSGTTALYEPCQETAECLPGLHCQSNVPEPQGGQCTHACASNDDCEAAGGAQVLCHPVSSTCVIGCGMYGGDCPAGLVCTDVQFCTEGSDLVPTKTTGESCTTALECLNGAACVSGEHTAPYCSPPCTTDDDCKVGAPDAVGTCNAAGGLTFCIYMCGFMANGADCPGDMTCEVAVCR